MPIYEYLCRDCGHQMEVLQKLSDDPLTDCPECQQAALKKKVSASAFRLKGAGWYETDFKIGDKKNLSKSDTGKSNTDSNAATDKTGQSAGKNIKDRSAGAGSNSSTTSTSGSKTADNK